MNLPIIDALAIFASALLFWQQATEAQAYTAPQATRVAAREPGGPSPGATDHVVVRGIASAAPIDRTGAAPSLPAAAPDCNRPARAVDRFQRSVDRGELVVLGRTLAWREFRPVSIEYAYDLGTGTKTVSIQVELAAAVPVPGHDAMVVRRVAAVMADDGSIAESRMYVTPR